ncbi:hypothetical protein [Pseudomonas sp. 3A(2025)]
MLASGGQASAITINACMAFSKHRWVSFLAQGGSSSPLCRTHGNGFERQVPVIAGEWLLCIGFEKLVRKLLRDWQNSYRRQTSVRGGRLWTSCFTWR